jgi:hypothetical protein
MTMSDATLILGRGGMGEYTETDFEAWVSYVADRIDEATGLNVRVEARNKRDVQDNYICGFDSAQDQEIRSALNSLWDDFCADPSAWPDRWWARSIAGDAIQKWAEGSTLDLDWETGEGDARLRGWVRSDGARAIETNGDPIWSEDESLDLPFEAYWEARSLSPVEEPVTP